MDKLSSITDYYNNNTSKYIQRVYNRVLSDQKSYSQLNQSLLKKFQSDAKVAEAGSANGRLHIERTRFARQVVAKSQSVTQRLGELSTQAQNSSLSAQDRSVLQSEADGLISELSDLMTQTTFNGQSLFQGETMSVQVDRKIEYQDVDGSFVTNALSNFDLSSAHSASSAMEKVKSAQSTLTNAQVRLGSTENTLNRSVVLADTKTSNLGAAASSFAPQDVAMLASELSQLYSDN